MAVRGPAWSWTSPNPASVDSLMERLRTDLGEPSILVNNAGITRDNLLMRMKESDWNSILDTNLGSVYRMSKACLRSMTKARKGRIINVASVVAVMGNAGQANYAAAKAGMIGFSKSLAREVGSRGITVNCVAPGLIDTDMTRALDEAHQRQILAGIPLGRWARWKRWPQPWSSWRRPARLTSPARPCMSMAACGWSEAN